MALNEANVGKGDRDPDLERLYSRTSREEPRSELDQVIRAAARREVRARPRALGARLRRWTLPVSLAAVVVLSVSVVTLMRDEGAGRVGEGLPAPVKPKAAAGAPSTGAKVKAAGKAEAPEGMRMQVPETLYSPAEESKGIEGPRAPIAGRARPSETISGEIGQKAADRARGSELQEPPATPEVSATVPAPRRSRVLSAPASNLGRVPAESEGDTSGKGGLAKSERLLTERQVYELVKELEKEPPEKWLEKIAVLRREGKSEAADKLLSTFKRRFPGYPLPEADRERGH